MGHWYEMGWDIDWILDQGLSYHLSVFMPKSSYIPDEWFEKIMEFNKRMGYRYVLRQAILPLEAEPGERIEYSMWIENVGVAPIYRPYRLAVRFRQGARHVAVPSKQDVRTWMPEHTWFRETLTVPRGLTPGVVDIDVAMVDPGTGAPAVKFAIEETLDDGWHPLTRMDVL